MANAMDSDYLGAFGCGEVVTAEVGLEEGSVEEVLMI